jgi:hypothetical protein
MVLYQDVHANLLTAREIVTTWRAQGLITAGQEALFSDVWTEAQAAMKAWKDVLVAAEAAGGTLPNSHPAVRDAARAILVRVNAIVARIAAELRTDREGTP